MSESGTTAMCGHVRFSTAIGAERTHLGDGRCVGRILEKPRVFLLLHRQHAGRRAVGEVTSRLVALVRENFPAANRIQADAIPEHGRVAEMDKCVRAIHKNSAPRIADDRAAIHNTGGKPGGRRGPNAIARTARYDTVANLDDDRAVAAGSAGLDSMRIVLHPDAVEQDPRGARCRGLDENPAAAGRMAVIADHGVRHVKCAGDTYGWLEPDSNRGVAAVVIRDDAVLHEQRGAVDKVDADASCYGEEQAALDFRRKRSMNGGYGRGAFPTGSLL
jgi:hypothetical protein